MSLGERLICCLVHESVAMVMEAGVWQDELPLFERLILMEKCDGMAAYRVVKTRVRGRAWSRSLVRV
jgi:hypothetical protein